MTDEVKKSGSGLVLKIALGIILALVLLAGGTCAACSVGVSGDAVAVREAGANMDKFQSGDDDDDEPAAATDTQGVTADDVTVKPDFVDVTGAPAILFLAKRPQASGLQGKKISWSLLVKRKTAPWNKAKSFAIGDSKVTAPVQILGDVSISIRYTTFASKGLSPGDYVAALLGNVKTTNVFRDEIPFALGAAPGSDDEEYVAPGAPPPPPVAAGPRAMDDKAFAGFLGAVSNTMMDSAKASMVKSACKKNWFSSAQLGQLLDVFMMEANRFEAAQAVVPRLVDPQNAYALAEKFMFNANKTAFTALLAE